MTRKLITDVIALYGEENVDQRMPCIKFESCEKCTANMHCAWIARSPGDDMANGIRITNSNGTIINARDLRFCWGSNPFGIKQSFVFFDYQKGNLRKNSKCLIKMGLKQM